ncbi:MAG: alpha/beta hydrolase, partial [Pseudomonadota bacterium]
PHCADWFRGGLHAGPLAARQPGSSSRMIRSALVLLCLCVPSIAVAQPKPGGALPPPAFEPDTSPLMSWGDLTGRALPSPTQTIRIGNGETDIVDLWLPEGEGPHPAILMIHGGCWQKSIADRTLMNYVAEALRTEGMAVWNIEYRGIDEAGGGYPGTFQDVARAVDALAAQGATYGFDTSRIVAFGHSAGGHLSLWAAGRDRLPENSVLRTDEPAPIYGVVNSGGLADLEASEPVTLPSCLAGVIGKLRGPEGFAETSPAELLPLNVRQVSVNATRDRIAPPFLGEQWTLKAELAGDEAQYVEVPGGHVELISPGTPAFATQVEVIRDLFAEE